MRIPKTDRPLLVVSDLHGSRKDFEKVCELHHRLKQEYPDLLLLFLGDLIHAYEGESEDSIYLLRSVRHMMEQGEALLLMGNHELSHVMHWNLKKGGYSFTARLELALGDEAGDFRQWFSGLPIALIRENILFIHSGASASFAGKPDPRTNLFLKLRGGRNFLETLEFSKEFRGWEECLKEFSSEMGVKWGETPAGRLLWELFMSKNEHTWPGSYQEIVREFLKRNFPETEFMVSGHIEEEEGFSWPAENHLRLCSSWGCSQKALKKVLLVAETVQDRSDLEQSLKPLYFDVACSS